MHQSYEPHALADLSVGQRFETGGRTITEADVVNFAGVSGDFTALHTDVEAAGESEFGERIVHGPLTFAVATGLFLRTGILAGTVQAFLGVDELRFPRPLLMDETVSLVAEVTEARPMESRPDSGLAVFDLTVSDSAGETVLTTDARFMIAREDSREQRAQDDHGAPPGQEP